MDGNWFDVDEVRELVPGTKPPVRPGSEDASRRLRSLGPGALTDGELLSVLGVSTTEADVKPLLAHGLPGLLESPELAFELAPQLTTRVLAALELARRVPLRRKARRRLSTPRAIADWAREMLMEQRREEAWVLSLNPRNAVMRTDRVGLGGPDHCIIDPREVLAPAVACRATGIVLVHWHPSGDPEPSIPDVTLTRRLVAAGKVLHVAVLDHVVVADRAHVSMLERGLLEPPGRGPVLRTAMSEVD